MGKTLFQKIGARFEFMRCKCADYGSALGHEMCPPLHSLRRFATVKPWCREGVMTNTKCSSQIVYIGSAPAAYAPTAPAPTAPAPTAADTGETP